MEALASSVMSRVVKTINNRLALLLAKDFDAWSASEEGGGLCEL
jgi:hypothetical protein